MSVINIGGCPPTSLESKSIVPRHRLLSLLNEGTKYPLTLCVASSGWGKGTLLTSWANHTDKHVSWLQVDESDNEVAMFYQSLPRLFWLCCRSRIINQTLPRRFVA